MVARHDYDAAGIQAKTLDHAVHQREGRTVLLLGRAVCDVAGDHQVLKPPDAQLLDQVGPQLRPVDAGELIVSQVQVRQVQDVNAMHIRAGVLTLIGPELLHLCLGPLLNGLCQLLLLCARSGSRR